MAHAMVQAAAPSVRLAGREPCGGWAAPRVPTARSRPVSAVSTPSEYRVINNRSEQFLESVALAADVLTDVQASAECHSRPAPRAAPHPRPDPIENLS